jgi:hypothetical protein
MTKRTRDNAVDLEITFEEALRRFAATKPGELAEAIAHDFAEQLAQSEVRIKKASEEIALGARSRGRRFRL